MGSWGEKGCRPARLFGVRRPWVRFAECVETLTVTKQSRELRRGEANDRTE